MKCLLGLLLSLFISAAMAQIKPADGLWGTTDNPAIGSGLMMTTQNGITVISVFTYDETGQNTWYIASGRVNEGNVFSAELIQSENGQNILLENPQSATFAEQRKSIRIEFKGSQLGTLQIGEGEVKTIKPNHYGFASTYGYPDLIGQWVIADKDANESFILDLKGVDTISPPISPLLDLVYKSQHPSTLNWEMFCSVVNANPIQVGACELNSIDKPEFPILNVDIINIGSQNFVLKTFDGEEIYQAFRLKQDSRLFPNDGLWRPADDPAIGSGMAMRTQGDFTVILLYSYDEDGRAIWQNAAGQFDENGKLVADLYTPNNGTAIDSTSPSTAQFEGEAQSLTIELIGMELAKFSIDGSSPKIIQNLNFATELYDSEQFIVDGETYQFPNQVGHWVAVENNLGKSFAFKFMKFAPNATITPPNPYWAGAQAYSTFTESNGSSYYFEQICPTVRVVFTGFPEELRPFCEGSSSISENGILEYSLFKTYFEDIGYNNYRSYYEIIEGNETVIIDRSSSFFQFYRLE